MKKLTILLFSIFISFNSYGEWTYVSETVDGSVYYIDKDKIKEHNDYVYNWVLGDYLKPTEYGDMSTKLYTQNDCGISRYKVLSFVYYKQPMGEGKGEPSNPINTEWRYPSPDSVYEKLQEFVCNYVK
jgi:hypothetical protein